MINVSTLVSELVTAQYAPQVSNIASQTSAVTTQISALGTFKSALSTFQDALTALDSPSSFNVLSAQSSDPAAVTASATSNAVAGTYSVDVTQLASAQQLVSNAFTGGSSAPIGTGSLNVSLGGQSINVTINSSNDTLDGIAAAINSATGNPGISATVLQGSDGEHLVLASSLTGASNTISVSSSGGNGGLAALDYSASSTGNYTQQSKPLDAKLSIAGVAYDSPSNTISGAITGVNLNLSATTGTAATIAISNNTSTVATNIQQFVSAYNALVKQFSSLGGYDATTGTAGPMLGNALFEGTKRAIQSTVFSTVDTGSPTYTSLASIGITANKDGTLSLNSATLQTALSANFNAVSQLFSSTSGIAATLNNQLSTDLASGGPIQTYSSTLVQQNNALTQQSNQITQEKSALTTSMTQQFAALNTLLSSLQTTSAYLTQAFASLPQAGNGSSNSSSG